MGQRHLRSWLGASFLALAAAVMPSTTGAPFAATTSPVPDAGFTPGSGDPLKLVRDLINRGERGVAFGDMHADLSLPQWLADNMRAFKAMGVKELRLEFPRDFQPQIDALDRSPEGIRNFINATRFIDYRGSALTRINMILAAKEAGLRVIAVDMASTDISRRQDRIGAERLEKERNLWGDVAIAEGASAGRDKSFYLLFVGLKHTYAPGQAARQQQVDARIREDRSRNADDGDCPEADNFLTYPLHNQGGVNRRLGIKAVDSGACGIRNYSGPPAVRASTGPGADYVIMLPTHPLQNIGYPETGYANWRDLLARDASALLPRSYAGQDDALMATALALSLLDMRRELPTGGPALDLAAEAAKAQLNELRRQNLIAPVQAAVINRHIVNISQARKDRDLAFVAPAAAPALAFGAAAQPISEPAAEGLQERLREQLASLRERQSTNLASRAPQ